MLNVLYQDPEIVVCEKPFRILSTHPPAGMPAPVRQALGNPQPAIRSVHRLDQVVGGVMVYARTAQAASALSRQIREGSFQKEYLAVTRPRDGILAWKAMLDFTRGAAKYVPTVIMTVVDKDKTPDDIEQCRILCESLGAHLRVREYISD